MRRPACNSPRFFMSTTAIACFDQISKEYSAGVFGLSRRPAVAGVSMHIEQGEVFALLGPNRAGKTTLVKILLSLCRATAGKAYRFGQPVSVRQTLTRVGYVHENPAFPRYLSAASLLEYYAALALVPEPEARARAAHLLELVGLADRCREPISRFSKGMVQRLALAQALINDPELLVLDEPSEGLDLMARRLVHQVIAERRRLGYTVLLVTHLLGDVEQFCDRLGVLVNGKLVFTGRVEDLTWDSARGTRLSLEQALEHLYQRPCS